MNWDLLFTLIFYGLLFCLFLKYRSKFEVQGKVFALYKTKLGLKLMDRLAKVCPRFWRILGYFSIGVCIFGLLAIFYILIKGTFDLLFVPSAAPAVAPVLPGVTIPGLPTLGFWHWIIGIFVVAVIHEFSHGLYARLYDIKIKSSGFAFLGPILSAFVEPDEDELKKKNKKIQLAVFSAGPFANIVAFFVVFAFAVFVFNPIVSGMMVQEGVKIYALEEGYPMNLSGAQIGEEIMSINGIKPSTVEQFSSEVGKYKPGDEVELITSNNTYNIVLAQHPKNETKGYLGVVTTYSAIKPKVEYGKMLPAILIWLSKLLFWIYIINFGIGLFNLLPLGPADGGRMFYTMCLFFTKDEVKVKRVWKYISLFCLALIIINLLPYLFQLVRWIVSLFI